MAVLFVGNGINQCAGIAPRWEDLFEAAVDIAGFQMQRSLTPTLEYELNIQKIQEQDPNKNSYAIQTSIANYLIKIQNEAPNGWENIIHKLLLQAAPHTIITTNYDYFLELAADPQFKAGAASTRRWKYSMDRYRDIPGHRIYHIHGELSGPASICLGFEQYVGSIQHIREELTEPTTENGGKYCLYDVLTGQSKPKANYWYYSFFTEDVYILGFGLDAAEQDIWWLLNYRANLYRQGLIKNKITYLDVSSPLDGMADIAPHRVLESIEDSVTSEEKEKVLADFGDRFSKNQTRSRFLGQRKAQLEAFFVEVVDCTDARDIPIATVGNKIHWDQVYQARYTRAVEKLCDTKNRK